MQTLKPGIRFKGFTDGWEQRKLGEICDKFADGDWIEAKDQSDSGVRLIQTGNIGVTEYIDKPDSAKWVSLETFYRLHCEEVYEGDILISRLPEPAGRACIIPNLGTKMITAVDCTIVRTNSYYSSRFLVQYLSTQIYFDEVNTCLAGGTRQRISRSNLADFNVFIPKIQEQQKIGSLFEQTDKLITLYKQKYEKLTTIKKSVLAKMFPAEGETAPQIRFKGFTEPWQKRKLGEICDKFADGDWIEVKDQSDSGVRLIQTGNIGVTEYIDKPDSAKWVSLETFYRLHCEEVYEGDILISRLPEPAGRACIIPNLGTKMITAVDCTIVRTNSYYSSRFLVQYLSTQIYFDEVNTCLAGGTRQRVGRSNLANFNISVPELKEQQQIGAFFAKLDNLIAMYKQKYEKLQTLKNTLLDKMFV